MSHSPVRGKSAAAASVFVILLLVAYPLSIGPAVWVMERSNSGERVQHAAESFYWPLIVIGESLPALDDSLHRYVDWWTPATPIPANAPLPQMAPPPLPVTTTVNAAGTERIGVDFD